MMLSMPSLNSTLLCLLLMALQHNEANASSMSEKWHEDNQAQAEEYIGRNDYHEHHYQTPEEETRLQSDLKIHLHLNHLPLGCQERNVSDGHELGRRSNSRGDQRMDEKGTTRSSRYFEDLRFFKSVIHPSIHHRRITILQRARSDIMTDRRRARRSTR